MSEKPVNLFDPEGNPVSVPSSSVNQAIQEGFRVPTPQEVDAVIKDQDNQEKYGEGLGNTLKAGAAGFARGATFGLSDQALTKSGVVKPETLSELEKRNPIASNVGQVAGAGAGLLTGEGELAGALSLPKAVSKIGTAVAENPIAKQVLSRYGSAAMGSAIEGAAYGLGNVVSEHALGDPHLNAEKIASEIGMGALLGGSLGAGFKFAETAVPPAVDAAKKAISGVSDLAQKGYAKASSFVSGKSADDILHAIQNRGAALGADEAGALSQDFYKSFGDQYSLVNKALKETNKDVRGIESRSLLDASHLPTAQSEFDQAVLKTDAAIQTIKANPDLYPKRYAIKLQELKSGLEKADRGDAAAIFDKINTFKQLLDPLARFGKVIPAELEDSITLIKGLRTDIKNSLENESSFGRAASRHASLNDIQNEFLTLQKQVQKDVMTKTVSRSGEIIFKPDQAKIERALLKPEKLDTLTAYQDASKKLLNQVEETYSAAPSKTFDKDAMSRVLDKNTQNKDLLSAHSQYQHTLQSLGTSPSNLEAATTAGAAITLGPAGGLAAASYDILRNPGVTIQRLTSLERAIHSASERIGGLTKKIFNPKIEGALKPVTFTENDYLKRSQQVQRLAGDPNGMVDTLEKATKPLYAFAPNTVGALHNSATSAVAFLSSKVPSTAATGPLDSPGQITQAEKAKFMNYYAIATNPYSALEQVKKGTLTPDTIETLNSVYPQLYAEMKKTLVKHMSESSRSPASLPYSTKTMLNLFLGEHLSSSLNPQSLQANQAALSPMTLPQPQAPKVHSTQGGLKQLNRSQAFMTPMQKANLRIE